MNLQEQMGNFPPYNSQQMNIYGLVHFLWISPIIFKKNDYIGL
jgi:hypothetical protein